MTDPLKPWDREQVSLWLERRLKASRLDQAEADRRGYAAQDDYDNAAAEEWVCHALRQGDWAQDQVTFAKRIKELVTQDEYPATSIHDDVRFERHIRSHLRKLAKMTKANEGFGKTLHHQ